MKKVSIIIIVGLLVALGAGLSAAQSGHDLFQKALVKERAEGNLQEAIQLYQRIVSDFSGDRPLAAKALLQMGQCYEKLGKDEARKAYERLVRDYADQANLVAQARTRLAALRKPAGIGKETGMVTRRVWAGPDADILGSVSSDGRYLSFVDWETGDLAIRDLEAGTNRRLTNKGPWEKSEEFALFSTPSPDGKQVAYAWYNEDKFFDLRLIGLDGSECRVLYSDERVYVQPHAWSPGGKHILATFSGEDRTNQTVLVSVADGSVRVLKTPDWQFPENWKIAFSPDGRYIAYDLPANEGSPNRDIFLLSTDGKRESALIEHPADDLYPVWTPDGKRILFFSDRTGSLGAWVIEVADGKPQGPAELVKPDLGRGILPLGFTRKGSFYYGLGVGMWDVYIAPLDLKTGKLLAPPRKATERFVGSNRDPDWSPDGRHLVYISRRGASVWSGSSVVCIRSVETGEERDLFPKLNRIWAPRWSPDGRSLLLMDIDVKNRRGFYLMDVQSGDVTPLVQTGEGEYIGQQLWSLDGKAVFYVRRESGTRRFTIVVRELETGQEKEVYHAHHLIQALALSPDGRQLAFAEREGNRGEVLRVMPARGGQPRELLRTKHPDEIRAVAWTPDGREVLFTKRRPSRQEPKLYVWRVPASGGEPRRLDLAMDFLRTLHFHPDGQQIAFSAGTPSAVEVWVMENFLPPAGSSK